jgi:Pretoxin HINT domain
MTNQEKRKNVLQICTDSLHNITPSVGTDLTIWSTDMADGRQIGGRKIAVGIAVMVVGALLINASGGWLGAIAGTVIFAGGVVLVYVGYKDYKGADAGDAGAGDAGGGDGEGSGSGEGSAGGGACFVGGTPVALPDGMTKPIEMIKAGDYVLSRNEVTASMTAQRVSRTWKHRVLLELTNGEKLETTKDHPLFVVDQGFTKVAELASGAILTSESGVSIKIGRITQNHCENIVYNIEVENFHTYFVGKNRLWAHNKEKSKPDEDD